ncbi:MAG TPA: AAA family ATPase [Thermoanaerobaculia bacterium]|nr:AAA family ATPase [Thermoanaerobaculia bacterium]
MEHLYLGKGHSEALAGLQIGIHNRRGLITLIGEVGMGKTTLAHAVIRSMDERVHIGYTATTTLGFRDMMKPAMVDLGLEDCLGGKPKLIWGLTQLLEIADRRGQVVAIVVDEAHNLSDECFEELRLLLNIETLQAKLLQLVLIGQPELEDRLANRNLRHLADRVAVSCVLNPLSPHESREYVKSRLIGAGASLDLLSPKALSMIVAEAKGVPRRINILCHNALLFAFGENQPRIEARHAEAAIGERRGGRLQRLDRQWWRPTRAVGQIGLVAAGVALGLLVGLLAFRALSGSPDPPAEPARAVEPATGSAAGAATGPTPGGGPTPNGEPTAAPRPEETSAASVPSATPSPAPASPAPAEGVQSERRPAIGVEAPSAAAPPPATPAATSATTAAAGRVVVVERGSSLYRLIVDEYGEYNPGLLQRVLEANPEIVDPDLVLPGLRVVLPERPGPS